MILLVLWQLVATAFLLVVSDVLGQGEKNVGGGIVHFKFLVVGKNFVMNLFLYTNAKFWVDNPRFGPENLGAELEFSASTISAIGNLQFLLKKWNFLPHATFVTYDAIMYQLTERFQLVGDFVP